MIKKIKTGRYFIAFNMETGEEILTGIDGFPDPFVLDMPNMLDIGIMGHCKNNCLMCYQGDKSQPNMKLEHYKKIMEEAGPYVNQVALGGRGDPNHHEHFLEILKLSRKHKIVPNYTTSGIDLNEDHIIASKLCGAVAVSDYQKPHTYNTLNSFMEAGIKTNIHTIFSSHNADRCIDMIEGKDVWESQVDLEKLNAVIFLLFKPQGKGKNLLDWIPTEDQVKRFAVAIKESKASFKIGMDSCMVNKVKQIGTKFSPLDEASLDTCEGGRMSSYITPDMLFMPCSFAEHSEHGQDIIEKSIQEVWWNSPSFINVREILRNEPASCPFEL